MTDLTDSPGAASQGTAGQPTGVASTAKDQAGTVAASAAGEAKALASEAGSEAKNVLSDTRQQLRTQANQQSEKVAGLIGDIGKQLRTMADAGQSGPAKDVVATVADQAQQISKRLGEGGLDRTLDDARRLARNRPGLFLAGAALAGFVAARLFRVADTDSLKQAASPSQGPGNGQGQPDLAAEAAMAPIGGPYGAPETLGAPSPTAATMPIATDPFMEGPG